MEVAFMFRVKRKEPYLMNQIQFYLMLVGSIVFSSCASIPEDAPAEFHEAQAALERMDNNDVEDYLPKTAEAANEKFERSLDLLEESKETNPWINLKRSEAIGLAQDSRDLAAGAVRITQAVQGWDQEESQFREALAYVNGENISPFAKLKNTELIAPIAYFDFDDTEPVYMSTQELDALAEVLKKDQQFNVVLYGHADRRGDFAYNKDLAMKRAEEVAEDLRQKGVQQEQIVYRSMGEQQASQDASSEATYQLDRRVIASLEF